MNHKRGRVKSRRAGCLLCKYWKHQGEKGSHSPAIMGARNFRLTQDRLDTLAGEDSTVQIVRELNATVCDDPFCDCLRYDEEAYEKALLEAVTGETAEKLAALNITVIWAT